MLTIEKQATTKLRSWRQCYLCWWSWQLLYDYWPGEYCVPRSHCCCCCCWRDKDDDDDD